MVVLIVVVQVHVETAYLVIASTVEELVASTAEYLNLLHHLALYFLALPYFVDACFADAWTAYAFVVAY